MANEKDVEFTVRPLPRTNTLDGAFRIHLTTKDLETLGVKPGDLCSLHTPDGIAGTGIAWRSTDANTKTNAPHVKLTDTFRDAFNLKLGNQVSITKSTGAIFHADTVIVTDVSEHDTSDDAKDDNNWRYRCGNILGNVEAIANGIAFEATSRKGLRKRFLIESINSSTRDNSFLFLFDDQTRLIMQDESAGPTPGTKMFPFKVDSEGIKGLDSQLTKINETLGYLTGMINGQRLPEAICRTMGGMLLFGPPGTGKSMIVDQIARMPWRKVLRIDRSTLKFATSRNQSLISSTIDEALAQQPSVVIMDDLHQIAGGAASDSMASILAREFDRLNGTRVLLVATAPHPKDVDNCLRRAGRLSDELEIPVPARDARAEILKSIHAKHGNAGRDFDDLADTIGGLTHGYVGADLVQLYHFATRQAISRTLSSEARARASIGDGESFVTLVNGFQSSGPLPSPMSAVFPTLPELETYLEPQDFESAMHKVCPTAMNEIFIEVPKVRWSQIGGNEEIKQRLFEGFLWSNKHREKVAKKKWIAERGVLLYGPPGCSKTMTAQAIASESGLNFLAVKGAELVSKYVGESERAIREVFRKARAAAPSILFFDEIDSIAGDRGGSNSGNGLHTLSTLLNEMDGIETLQNVLVLAATNKPQTIDPALLRPGRFEKVLYVAPPDRAARREIFRIGTAGMLVSDDVDYDVLASRTDGYSGADIRSACNEAARLSLSKWVATTPAEAPPGSSAGSLGEEPPLCAADFEAVLETMHSSLSPAMVEELENWHIGL